MNVRPKPAFLRHLKKITDRTVRTDVNVAVVSVMKAVSVKDIPELKKMKGTKIYFRIKVGNYRIGLTIEGDMVTFIRCLPRKDFYKGFP